eukprot:scaffold3873_cov42-Attheya_sp.AAC.1
MPSANTRAAGRGTIRKAAESPDESIMKMRFDHGLCVTCNAQLCEVTETGGRRKLNPMTTLGVSKNGRCLYCHPEHETHSVKDSVKEEEEENWEDAATVPVEEVETGEDIDDQSLAPVIALDRNDKRFVGVVSEGNTKKGKGIFRYVEETGEQKGKSIVYEGAFADGCFEGRGSLRDHCRSYFYEGQWKKSKSHGQGKETHENGDMYEGEQKNDMVDGHGTYTEANGNRYEGNWKDNEYDGQGTYTWVNGDRFEGEWENDMKNGNGKQIFKNGDIYEGNWKDDKRDGQGTLRYTKGRAKVGTWKKNKFVG